MPRREVAQELANAHRQSDPETTTIKYFESAPAGEIFLLEVSDSAPTIGEILPFRFPPYHTNGEIYSLTVILVSPDEWLNVQTGILSLPVGWNKATMEDI
ncbi:MAG: hypothetical protein NTX50_22155 [Candidatus Sumerlaeota bacterium]|nr:hypothetical protein [Candidatus Sumerlaeota bacterium]